MFRFLAFLIVFLSSALAPSFAAAKTVKIKLDSDIAGTTVNITSSDNPNKVIHSCQTPCSVKLQKKKREYQKEKRHLDTYYLVAFYKRGYLRQQRKLYSNGKRKLVLAGMKKAEPIWEDTNALLEANCKVVSGDHPAFPCVRRTPYYATSPASYSDGQCEIEFQVDEYGVVFNGKIVYCTEKHFAEPMLKNVREWRYIPKVQAGKFVVSEKITTKVKREYLDLKGKRISEIEESLWYYPSE